MDAKFLLLSLLALSSLQIVINANPANFEIYDIDFEFNETLHNLSTILNEEVEVALVDVINVQDQVVIIAIGEIQIYNEEISKNEEDVLEEIEKISESNCRNAAENSLEDLKDKLTESMGNCFEGHVNRSEILSEEGQREIKEHLDVLQAFQNEFLACSDEECKMNVLQKVVDETGVAQQKVQETSLRVANDITQLIIAFNKNCLLDNLDEFEGTSELIVGEAKKCAEN